MKISVVEAYAKSRLTSKNPLERARFRTYLNHLDGLKAKAMKGEPVCPQAHLIALDESGITRSLDKLKDKLNKQDYVEASQLKYSA